MTEHLNENFIEIKNKNPHRKELVDNDSNENYCNNV